jgi:hypothetical protein
VAYPQPPETDALDDSGLDDLDASMAALEDEDKSLGLTDDLSDELELNLEDFDDTEMEATGLSADADDELELDLNDGDDSDLELSEDGTGGDELPDLGDFEDLAGLDDDALGLDDTDEELENLDLDLGDDTASDELDLDLADLDLDEADEAALEVEDSADSDDLDLGLDLDLDDDTPTDEISDDLDLDLDLDLEEEESGEIEAAGAEIEEADELDLSDLELEEEGTPASDDTAEAVSDDLDLDLDLEEETSGGGQTAKAGAETKDGDELDLSDLEEIIDSEEPAATKDAVEDLELDFDLDGKLDTPAGDAGAAAESDSDLDLSDLEQMLETDDAPAADGTGDELDLQFDIDEQPAAEGADAAAATGIDDGAGEDDLLDIEKMLEGGDGDTSDLESADEDLSLTMEAALDDAAQGADDDLDLDFDIESELQDNEDLFDSSSSSDDALESNLLDADDVDLLDETGTENDSLPVGATTDEFATDDFSSTQGDFGATDVLPLDDSEAPETVAAVAKPKKSRSKKPVLVVILLFLLALGVLVIPKGLGINIPYISDINIPYLSDLDLKIPYLSDWLNPEAQDVAGNLRITPLGKTISGKFVNTANSGRLFVIRGKIKNEYDHPRSFVKVTGKLYQGSKKLVRKSTVYIGNVIPESELARMNMADINKRMKNKFGDKRSNLKIQTGKMVPFMIVFDRLPKDLDEYTVEVASSSI